MVRGILGSLNQDAVGRAGPRAELAADAALQAVVVALQHVPTPEAGIHLPLLLRILDRYRPGEHGLERKCHALDERANAGNAIANGTHTLITSCRLTPATARGPCLRGGQRTGTAVPHVPPDRSRRVYHATAVAG